MTKRCKTFVLLVGVVALICLAMTLLIFNETSAKNPTWSHQTEDDVRSVAISADGEYIACGSGGKVYLFHKDSSDPLWTYTTTGGAGSTAISADGNYIAAGAGDTRLYLFEQGNSEPEWNISLEGDIRSVAISADGEYIVVGTDWENKTYLYKRTSGSVPQWDHTSDDGVGTVAISGNGDYIVTGSWDTNVTLFDKGSSTPLWNYQAGDAIETVDISMDGNHIVAGSDDGKVYLFEKGSSNPLWSYETGDYVNSVAISADGEFLAAGSDDNNIYLFEKGSSTPLWSHEADNYVYSVDISADGAYITAGSNDDKVYLFKKESGNPFWTYQSSDMGAVAISSDGQSLVAGSDDWSIYFFTNEQPVARIDDSMLSDPAEIGETLTFSGWESSDDGNILEYHWESWDDGVLYRGPENEFECDNLSMNYHIIALWVMDDYGVWSEGAYAYINITPPETVDSDYDSGSNPSPILFSHGYNSYQEGPSIYDGVVVWDDGRYMGTDVFMFDTSEDDKVKMLSYPSYLLEDPNAYEYVSQDNVLINGDTVIWNYYNSSEGVYKVYSYDLRSSDWGGEELFQIEEMPLEMMMSDRWVVWSVLDTSGPGWDMYALHSYNILTQETKKLFYFGGYFSLSGDQLLYVKDSENIFAEECYLVIYDLVGEAEVGNVTVYASSGDVGNIDIHENYLIWEDGRRDESGLFDYGNTDIYFINLDTEQEGQVTTHSSTQMNPKIQGDYIVWESVDGNNDGIYAYSISRNKTAVLSENDSNQYDAQVWGDYAVWVSDSLVHIFDLSAADWGESEAIFIDLDKRESSGGGGGGNGGGGLFDEITQFGEYDVSGEERDDEDVAGLPPLILVYLIINFVPIVFGSLYIYRTNARNMKMFIGLALSILMLIMVALFNGVLYKNAEDYDEWMEDNPELNDSITVAGTLNYKENRSLMGETIYTYAFDGSDYAFHSMEDVGDEGDYVIVEIEYTGSIPVPGYGIVEIYETKSDTSPHGFLILFTALNFIGLVIGIFIFSQDYKHLSLFGIDRDSGEGGRQLCPMCEADLDYVEEYGAWYCPYCQDYQEPRVKEKKKKEKSKKTAPKKKEKQVSCDHCGDALSYIDEYQQWYCYTCADYREPRVAAAAGKKKKAKGAPAAKKSTAPKCRQCHQPMNYIQEYDRLYCYTCQRYADATAGGAATSAGQVKKTAVKKATAPKKATPAAGKKKLSIKCSKCGKTGQIPATAKRPLKIKCSGCGNTKVIK